MALRAGVPGENVNIRNFIGLLGENLMHISIEITPLSRVEIFEYAMNPESRGW